MISRTELAREWLEMYGDLRVVMGLRNPELELLRIMIGETLLVQEEVMRLYHEEGERG